MAPHTSFYKDSNKRYRQCFVQNGNKTSRQIMLETLKHIRPNFWNSTMKLKEILLLVQFFNGEK